MGTGGSGAPYAPESGAAAGGPALTREEARTLALNRTQRLAIACVLYGGVLALCLLYAHWKLFTSWRPYDDTGFNTYAIRLFMDGQTLYNQLFSPYGPFPYELWGGLFKVLGVAPSTDTAYVTTYVMWLATSLLIGFSAQRLSGRLAIGICAQLISFVLLAVSINEPMLPDLLATALLVALEAAAIFGLSRRPRAALAVVGALVGVLVLTKVNVGGFAMVAVAYATIMALPQLRQLTWLRWCAVACVVLIGPVLMAPDLHTVAFAKFALLVVCATIALVLATGATPVGTAVPGQAGRWIRALVTGVAVSVVVILAVIFILGTSPGALFETLIVNGPRQRTEHPHAVTLAAWVSLLALAVAGAAWAASRTATGRRLIASPSWAMAATRIACGLLIWFPPTQGFALRISLAWVAALPTGREEDSAAWRFVRVMVPAVAVLNSLFAYPIAGSQVGFAETMFVLCGAVCVTDGLNDPALAAALSSFLRIGRGSARTALTVATVTFALAISLGAVALSLGRLHRKYDSYRALPFSGAKQVRLPQAEITTFSALITAARAHCRTLITTPGLPSLNLWSGLPAPSSFTIIGLWWEVPPSHELTSAYRQAASAPGLCEIRNAEEIHFWVKEQPLPRIPLVRYLERDFTPIGTYGEATGDPRFVYQLLKRREGRAG